MDVELLSLIDRYWDLAYTEGKEGRDHDTEEGDAALCRYEIEKRIRELNRHGAGDAGHSPDAGKMGEDSARLDYIERTFSGMTNRERYLPVTMIWGTGANGRTLREACDKYMAKDAARAGERG